MTTDPTGQISIGTGPNLRRRSHRRILGGVAAGLADYLSIDVAVVRIAFVVLSLLGGAGVPVYLAAWLFIPEEGEAESVAEQWLYRQPGPFGHSSNHEETLAR